MRKVRVKICGVRTIEEAEAAVEAGADALGFNFWPGSLRYITPGAARDLNARVFALVSCVGVFVNETQRRISEIVSEVGLSAVQLHGDETPEFCAGLKAIKTIKALRVARDFDYDMIKRYPVNMVLLDTSAKGNYGGTGKVFDWSIAIEAKKYAPIILAGGLNAENVAEAMTAVCPSAIDVCSSIEAEPGRKDLKKLRDFLREVARVNATLMAEKEFDPRPINQGISNE